MTEAVSLRQLGIRRLGVMAALDQELGDLITHLQDHHTEQRARRDYHCGHIQGQALVAVTARVGKVAAASTVTTLIERFGCDAILFVGVAGGLGTGVQIGDVVVANQLAQHDLDASPVFPAGEIPLLGVRDIATDAALSQTVQHAATQAMNEWSARSDHPHFTRSQLHQGLIVSGDQFIHASTHAADILRRRPEALATEMEGAAVAQVCFEHQVPVAVVRTISDRADDQATTDFTQFLHEVAAPMSSGLLKHLLA
jgi:adenosylhomocysteine nucleosidase